MAYCKKCKKEVEAIFFETPNTVHYGKEICKNCGAFIKWVSKPDNKPIHTKFTIRNFKIDYCELCGRKKDQLGHNETLEIHHKKPLCENGKDEKENILILCTACHKLAHWLRVYFNYHHQRGVKC